MAGLPTDPPRHHHARNFVVLAALVLVAAGLGSRAANAQMEAGASVMVSGRSQRRARQARQ